MTALAPSSISFITNHVTTLNGITITLFVTLMVYFIQWKMKRRHLYELASRIPPNKSVTLLPILGHAHYFACDTEGILNNVYKFCEHHSTPVWLGHRLFFMITRPRDLEIILNSPKSMAKDDLYTLMTTFVGEGLFTAPVAKWKKHRKLIMPTFNQRILDSFVEVFASQSEILSNIFNTQVGHTFDIFERIGRCNLDIVCETAMGIKVNAQTTDSEYAHRVNRAMDIIMMRMFNVFYHFDFIYNLSALSREERKIRSEAHTFTDQVIKEKKAEYKARMVELKNKPEAEIGEVPKKKVFLDLLLELSEAGANFSDVDLRDEVNTFMIAGTDTSATSISFAFIMLAMHPEIEEKVYAEVMDVLGDQRSVEYSDLPKFKYMELVLKETMRLFPIGPLIVRKIEEDLAIADGTTLPAGSGVVLVIGWMMRSAEYYDNPMTFNPDRFLPEAVAKRHPYAYLPFSAGPRNCIGVKYGMMQMKTLMATIVRQFKLETDYKTVESIRLKQSIIIKPVSGYPIRVVRRN